MELRLNDGYDFADSMQSAIDATFEALPTLLFALLIFIVGYFISRMLQKAAHRLMNMFDLNGKVQDTPYSKQLMRLFPNPAEFVGKIVFWVLMLGVISLTVSALGIQSLIDLTASVYSYLPHVLAAILIFVAASAISGFINRVIDHTFGNTPTGEILSTTAPIVVMSIAFFMILDQLQIAGDIVNITYTAIMGGLALGLALAFGLGGKDVAGKILESAYNKSQRSLQQAKNDKGSSKK